MHPKYKYLLILLLFCFVKIVAQPPNWDINPADFANNMSVTAQIQLDGAEANNGANMVAAFVGSEIRGVATPQNIAGKDYYFLPVFSNVSQGETVQFQVYLESQDAVYSAVGEVAFQKNGQLGGYPDGFLIDISLDNDFPISLLPIPNDTTLSGYPLSHIYLMDYLFSKDNDPVGWDIIGATHLQGILTGDTLEVTPLDSAWTGTDSLMIKAAEIGTPNSYADSQWVHFQIYPDYGTPVFGYMPDEVFEVGEPLPEGNLNDELTFGGPCLQYEFQIPFPQGDDSPPNWTPPVGGGNSMTLVVEVDFAGQPFSGNANVLAGFVNGVLAGKAIAQEVAGKTLYYISLTDVGEGEIIWQFYDADHLFTHQKSSGIPFVPYEHIGSFENPVNIDFAPFELVLKADGQWLTNWLDTMWVGSLSVDFFTEDCEYKDKKDTVSIHFHSNQCSGVVNTWVGAGENLHWVDGPNWIKGYAPLFCDDVLIHAPENVIVREGETGKGKTLLVEKGAELMIQLGGEMTIK